MGVEGVSVELHRERTIVKEAGWRRLPPSRDAGEARLVVATIPSEYLAWLQRACADVSLLGQDPHKGQAFTLNHVYVPALAKKHGLAVEVKDPQRKRGRPRKRNAGPGGTAQ